MQVIKSGLRPTAQLRIATVLLRKTDRWDALFAPEEALRAAYGSEELYKRNVLRLRSNFDEVVEKILEIEVPEEMKTDAYLKLCKDVSFTVML